MITPDSVIDSLGGTKAVAAARSVSVPTVSVWRKRGIPSGHWLGLAELAAAKGKPGITLETLAQMAGKREEEARA